MISSLKFCCSIFAVEVKIAGDRLFFDRVECISVSTLNLIVTINSKPQVYLHICFPDGIFPVET